MELFYSIVDHDRCVSCRAPLGRDLHKFFKCVSHYKNVRWANVQGEGESGGKSSWMVAKASSKRGAGRLNNRRRDTWERARPCSVRLTARSRAGVCDRPH